VAFAIMFCVPLKKFSVFYSDSASFLAALTILFKPYIK